MSLSGGLQLCRCRGSLTHGSASPDGRVLHPVLPSPAFWLQLLPARVGRLLLSRRVPVRGWKPLLLLLLLPRKTLREVTRSVLQVRQIAACLLPTDLTLQLPWRNWPTDMGKFEELQTSLGYCWVTAKRGLWTHSLSLGALMP